MREITNQEINHIHGGHEEGSVINIPTVFFTLGAAIGSFAGRRPGGWGWSMSDSFKGAVVWGVMGLGVGSLIQGAVLLGKSAWNYLNN
jgi:hypothetical protein